MAKPKSKSGAETPAAPTPAGAPPQTELQGLTFRMIDAVRPHAKKILAVVGAVAVVIAGLSVYTALERRKRGKATRAFQEVVATATAPVDEAGPQISLEDPNNPQISMKKAEIKTFEERGKLALEQLEKLEASNSGKVVTDAKILKAGLLYDAGKFDEAVAAYREFLGGSPPADLAVRAREGIGYALEAKALAQADAAARNAGLDEAAKAFADIERDDKGPSYGLALYHRARITALKGDKAGAIALYKEVAEKAPGTVLEEDAKNRLALLEAK